MKSEGDALLRTGRVVGYTPRGLLVDVSVKESCQQCAQGRGCGMGVLARQQRQRIEVKTSYASSQLCEHYPLGTSVTLTLGRSDITLLALLVYALPLLVALLLSGGVAALDGAVWWAPASFFMTLFVGCVILKKLISGRTERFRPQLVS
ncbi:SoxR reducing system RseC family protein [Halomonas sp. TP35]